MSKSTIGIKIADGSYYPILNDGKVEKKKLILTTVNDDQPTVQIDLYKGNGKEISEAVYIGSLVIENITPAKKGDPEIELIIGIDKSGNLNATAGDMVTGEHQSLSVSLESLAGEGVYDVPDFELDTKYEPESFKLKDTIEETAESEEAETEEVDESAQGSKKDFSENKPAKNPLTYIGFLLVSLGLIALLIVLMFKLFSAPIKDSGRKIENKKIEKTADKKDKKAEKAKKAPKEEKKAAEKKEKAVEEVKTIAVPLEKETVKPSTEKSKISLKAGLYKIKRGDTLWDISESAYGDPWLYQKIADENKIKNPDLIFAGREINISEK